MHVYYKISGVVFVSSANNNAENSVLLRPQDRANL